MLFNNIHCLKQCQNEDLSKYVLLVEDNTQLAKRTMKRISESMNRLIQKAEKKKCQNEDLSKYVLLVEDNTQLAKRTMKRISESMNRLIQKAEKNQHNNLLKLLEEFVGISAALNGVVTFDNDQFQSPLPVEHVSSWSLPIISLTCIAVVISDIRQARVDNLFKSVGEGLLYTHLVEETLNREAVYKYRSTNGEVEKENLPWKVIVANSMYHIAKTILHTYKSKDLDIVEDELFTRLSGMIAGILVACLTNIQRAIAMR
ncbi:hypothetical protein Hanom_Chr06g00509341 [Helianthus anomalus]